MHEEIFRYFEEILSRFDITGKVLEIGAVPSNWSLLTSEKLVNASERIGLNLAGAEFHEFAEAASGDLEFKLLEGNANDMSMFRDGEFQVVLSNATLEHDKFFWRSLREMRRVLRPEGLMIIGVPGYVAENSLQPFPLSTLTHRVHDWPGDYYRFSIQACREVFFENFRIIDQKVLLPRAPKIVTSGIKLS